MSLVQRTADTIVRNRGIVLAAMLVVTLVVGYGAGQISSSGSIGSIATDSEAAETDDYIQANFSSRDENTTTALFAVRDDEGNVLSRASLLRSLRFQQQLRENQSLNDTLATERPTSGVANIVARTAMLREYRAQRRARGPNATGEPPTDPTTDEQIAQLESMNSSQVDTLLKALLAEDSAVPGNEAVKRLLPRGYEAGTTSADARLVVVTFHTQKEIREPGTISDGVVEDHAVARDIAKSQPGPETYLTFGAGYIPEQLGNAVSDSFAIIGPLALVFVFLVLTLAYRDLLDIVLGFIGIFLVLIWTFGLMGWAGIPFNQVMIAVPILLIGLSVDYALHVIMRYREERESDESAIVGDGMARGLGSIGTALLVVTVTTAIGFLANLTSPVGDMQDFGVLTAFGIVSALVVFGVIVPTLKVIIDSSIESRGYDRSKAAFGSNKQLSRLLTVGSSLARRAPVAVIIIALLTTGIGVYGATTIDSSFTETSVMGDDPPGWADDLPESVQPGEYYLKENRDYIFSQFQTPDKEVNILVEGDVTRPGSLDAVSDATSEAGDANVTFVKNGDAQIRTPITAMERAAQRNQTFNETFHAADTDGDGVPDRDLSSVYDGFYGATPNIAEQFIQRTDDGDYIAMQMIIAVDGGANPTIIESQIQGVASGIEGDNAELSATATGQPILSMESDELLATAVVEGLGVTIVALIVILLIVFRVVQGSASLGALTIVPVLISVSWLLGTMAALDIPFSFVTSVVGSIALGLGVDYSIHVSERFAQERDRHDDPIVALKRTVRGTGGALLSSAATTAVGFGVLGFALLPALRRFGLLLGLGVIYSFLASVIIFPSILVLWDRYLGVPNKQQSATPVAGDD